MKKICVITCYKDPDYIRARTIRQAVELMPDAELVVVKNTHKDIRRYVEVLARLIAARIQHRPEVYILTFRGYELLPFVWLLTLGKRLIYDEFINLVEWVVFEHAKVKAGGLAHKVIWWYYKLLLRLPSAIITDTQAHVEYSAQLMNVPLRKFTAVPVAADETMFMPQTKKRSKTQGPLKVFYYGNMLPLHGLKYVLAAAVQLKDKPIEFTLSGITDRNEPEVKEVITQGARITYHKWIDFAELPHYAYDSDVCLGGPLGERCKQTWLLLVKRINSWHAARRWW